MNTKKGYKVTDSNMQCRDYQFYLGETHKIEGEIIPCKNGFHFCDRLIHCFNYYDFNPKNRVFEIEYKHAIEHGSKKVTDEITFIKELSWYEVLSTVNSGGGNIGIGNSGNNNIGNYNSGDDNSGSYTSGNTNKGERNSGYCNSGDKNSGYHNTGWQNSGGYNSGSFNSGNNNSGGNNSGCSNSEIS